MTVADLIKVLQTLTPDAEVWIETDNACEELEQASECGTIVADVRRVYLFGKPSW